MSKELEIEVELVWDDYPEDEPTLEYAVGPASTCADVEGKFFEEVPTDLVPCLEVLDELEEVDEKDVESL